MNTICQGLFAATLILTCGLAHAQTLAPTNLRVKGLWTSGLPTDQLTWDATTGATKYKIYRYGDYVNPLAINIMGTTYTVPTSQWLAGLTYTVVAVNAAGYESVPSNITLAQGAYSPSVQQSWYPGAPQTPTSLQAIPERNNNKPRLRLVWGGHASSATYSVYRAVGTSTVYTKIAEGVWGLTYVDAAVTAPNSYSYKVTASNIGWSGTANVVQESAQSAAVSGVAPSTNPASSAAISIQSYIPNDDSAVVTFSAVAGAKDYRVYTLSGGNTLTYKYTGGKTSAEINNLSTTGANTVYVEALDKLGPFAKMDGATEPGMAQSNGTTIMHVNGQGDPSNKPNVLGTSAGYSVTCQPFNLTGTQVFLDKFTTFATLTSQVVPAVVAAANPAGAVDQQGNATWTFRNYGGDGPSSRVFSMSKHLMDTYYDGSPLLTSQPLHVAESTLVMFPASATADMSNNNVLHVTFEVDGHLSGRRWCTVHVAPTTDELLQPNKELVASPASFTSGNRSFFWRIMEEQHKWGTVLPDSNNNAVRTDATVVWPDRRSYLVNQPTKPAFHNRTLNGSTQDLDLRHRYDLYLSNNRAQLRENGEIISDNPLTTPLGLGSVKVYFVHYVYHTSNDRNDLISWRPAETYWINHRPFADERHWDNMGFEILTQFPV
jgi:hypothetical protein